MKIYYDPKCKEWYQTSLETIITIGGEKTRIAQKFGDPLSISFEMKLNNKHAGPMVGILTGRKADGMITGNSTLFVNLQKKLTSLGGFSFIFTPADAFDDYIDGYTFLPESDKWKKVRVPYPDLVYNRVPFRKLEQENICTSLFTTLTKKNIPFFNPCFLDKFELYCLFQKKPALQRFLPATALVDDQQLLYAFLQKYNRVYLKPSQSAKGKGVFRLYLEPSESLQLEGIKQSEAYPSFQTFWDEWEAVLLKQPYIVQEEIKAAQFEGKRYDFRILTHANKKGYSVTGIGVRQAQKQEITTHIPNGGRRIPYELVQTEEHDQFIKAVVNEIGPALSTKFGYFGEFSIDAGIDLSGNYYLYEVNSKPMSFDEEAIEERKVAELCRLFLELTGIGI